MILQESSLVDLYNSAVRAFPLTTKRQHATQPIKITQLYWTPFQGMRTLLVRGTAQNEGRSYQTLILFKKVEYNIEEGAKNAIKIISSTGQPFLMEKLRERQELLVRCQCSDFRWRFNFYNYLDESLYGRKASLYIRKTDREPANPLQLAGLCKHILKTTKALADAGLFL